MDLSPNVRVRAGFRFAFGCSAFFLLITATLAGTPYSTSQLHEVETPEETKIREIRTQEITQLRIALGRRIPTNRRADLYFRLAEINLEFYRSEFLLEGRVHEKRIEAGISDKFIDRSHSRPYILAGIKSCQEIISLRIPYDRIDQVYYFLGVYYGELDNQPESVKNFGYLVQQAPHSPFVGFAYQQLGKEAFRTAQFKKAVEFLELARHHSNPDTLPSLLHKLAWSYYRIKLYDVSIATMKESIALASENPAKFSTLKEEALRDMATLMTERGRVDEAIQYFQGVAGDQKFYPKILEKLGRQYERNVEVQKAIQVYETLLKTSPESESGFRVGVKLVELEMKQGHFTQALDRLKSIRMVMSGDAAGSAETQAAAQNLRVMIRKVATDHHQMYRKTNSRVDLEVAESFYSAYLEYFLKKDDTHREIPEIRMYLAEVKRDLGKAREVAELYRQVVQSKDKRFAKQAGTLWMSSLVEAMKKSPNGPGQNASQPSDLEKEFIQASDLFQESLGDSKDGSLSEVKEASQESKDAALRVAQVLAGYKGTRHEAMTRIKLILSRWPGSRQALTAAQLWLQLYLDQKPLPENPEELIGILKDLRGNRDLMAADQSLNQGKIKAALDQQELKIKVGSIARDEKEHHFIAAARGYAEFANESKDRDLAEKSYTNAINAYLNAYLKEDESRSGNAPAIAPSIAPENEEGSYGEILRLAEIWNKRFPHSPKLIDPMRTVATHALIQGKLKVSARIFEKLGTEYQDPASLETTARIEDAIGDSGRAQQAWVKYLEIYKSSPQRWGVALALARSQDAAGLDGEAARAYRYCAAGPPAYEAECQARLADLYLRDKDLIQAKALYQKVASLGLASSSGVKSKSKSAGKPSTQPSTHPSPFVGYARYKLADLKQSEAQFEPLRFPEAQLQKGLNQRLNFLEPLSRSYQSVGQAGGPWAIAALNNLALWATHFADEVDGIEPPPSLKGPSLEKFRKDLGSVSLPLREKARTTWNEAYSKAASLHLMSPALPEVADHLADFKVLLPGRAQGGRGGFHLAGNLLSSDGGPEALEAAFHRIRVRLIKNANDANAWTDYGNLFWGDHQPLMARLAYERALALNSALNKKDPIVLNNLAVVKMSGQSVQTGQSMKNGNGTESSGNEEDWIAVGEAVELLEEALRVDDFFLPAKMNLATVMNYYRIFAHAKLLWDQIQVRNPSREAEVGLAVALQGVGSSSLAEGAFQQLGRELGQAQMAGASTLFVYRFHEAARSAVKGKEGADQCISILESLDLTALVGFEKNAVIHLKEKCELWKRGS